MPGKLGGGLVGIIITLAVVLLPRLLGGTSTNSGLSAGSGGSPASPTTGSCRGELESIICGATQDVQNFWKREFAGNR